jgi:hypothetical protein
LLIKPWLERAAGWTGTELLYLISAQALGPQYQDDGMTNLVTAPASETFSIVGTCINCTAPASLLATMTIIAIGVALAFRSERRNGASAKS